MTLKEYLHTLKGRRAAVIGIGVSNTPLIRLLLGAGAEVTACDRKDRSALGPLAGALEAEGCRLHLGEDYLEHLEANVVFRTPGLHPKYLDGLRETVKGAVPDGMARAAVFSILFDTCLEKGWPLSDEWLDGLLGGLKEELP